MKNIENAEEAVSKMKIDLSIERVIDYFTSEQAVYLNAYNRGEISKEHFLKEVQRYIDILKLEDGYADKVLKGFADYLWDFDAIKPLIEAEDITDIHCLGYKNIRVKQIVNNRTIRQDSGIYFGSKEHYKRFVNHLAIRNKADLNEQNAIQRFVDKHSNQDFRLRCNIVTGFVTCTGEPYLHIRKEAKKKKSIKELESIGMFDTEVKDILLKAVSNPIIVAGAGGSGKTAFINALMEMIPVSSNGIIVQSDDELFSEKHPELIPLHTIERRIGGSIEYTLHDLARNSLLMDQDYIIFGEVKGAEARYAFTATITGHIAWLSLHAPNARAAMDKFADYVKFESDMKLEDIYRMLGNVPFTLIHIENFKIDEIVQVGKFDEVKKTLIYQDVFKRGE